MDMALHRRGDEAHDSAYTFLILPLACGTPPCFQDHWNFSYIQVVWALSCMCNILV